MPLEGHWQKQSTPLRRLTTRERRAGLAVFVVTVVALLAIVVATAGDRNPPTPKGCISATVAGIVGAETISGCGAEAEAKCAHAALYESPRAHTVVAECERQGIEF